MKSLCLRLLACLVPAAVCLNAQAIPIPDEYRVVVNGVTWVQLPIFNFKGWDEFNAVCPVGECSGGSSLNGFDLSGWNWAGPEEVAGLFNHYLYAAGVRGSDLLDPSVVDDSYTETVPSGTSWLRAIANDFWPTGYDHTGGYYLNGWVSGQRGHEYSIDHVNWGPTNDYRDRALSRISSNPENRISGWFFCGDSCPPSVAVTLPPSWSLIALSIVGLWARRRGARASTRTDSYDK